MSQQNTVNVMDLVGFDSLLNEEEIALRSTVREFVDATIRPNIAEWYDGFGIVDAVRAGLPYIGVSAGAAVAGPDIAPLALLDDPAELDRILARGAQKGHEITSRTLSEVMDAVGFLPPAR